MVDQPVPIFHYQSCYCEENIWHLCQEAAFTNSEVVFIASLGDGFPMLAQKAAENPELPVYWDYHVILLVLGTEAQVYDFDSTLGFGVNAEQYFQHSFPVVERLPLEWQPLFRVIPASQYASTFSSDRSHMKTASGWLAPQPDWSPIGGHAPNNLEQFRDMTNRALGEVLTYRDIMARF